MTLYGALGRTSDVHRIYNDLVALLADELKAEPDPGDEQTERSSKQPARASGWSVNYEERVRDDARDGGLDAVAFVEAVVAEWVREYLKTTLGHREIVEVKMANGFTYIYDSTHRPPLDEADNRVLGAWGRSRPPAKPRDASRMRGYPSPQRDSATPVDRGHLIAHTIGGEYDMNLIPQDAALNRGIGEENRRWRELERYCAAHPGTLLLVRAIYGGNTDRPAQLEYCVIADDGTIRLERFVNPAAAG